MSAFDNYEKDEVVDAIKNLVKDQNNKGKSPREIVKTVMEVVTYGLDVALYDLKDKQVDPG